MTASDPGSRTPDPAGRAERLRAAARELSDRNWIESAAGGFHLPSAESYCSFFAWDSGWNVIGLSVVRPDRALRELQTIFALQETQGPMAGHVPHEVRFPNLGRRDGPARLALIWLLRKQYDARGRSRFIDPPSYLLAAEVLWRRTGDARVLELLPAMERCLDYLLRTRDRFGDGLISLIHPWESGCDSAPIFEAPLGVHAGGRLASARREWRGLRLYHWLDRCGWDVETIARGSRFLCEDVGTNGIAAAGALAAATLADAAAEPDRAARWRATARGMVDAMERVLWDDARGSFFPRYDPQRPTLARRTCANALAPLMTGLVSPDKAARVVDGFLASERHFAAPWPVAFNSREEIARDGVPFQPQALWRGPCVWISMNWIAARAAARAGRADVAEHITERTAELVDRSGFREYYDPETGRGAGARGFTWPALVLDMLETHGPDVAALAPAPRVH